MGDLTIILSIFSIVITIVGLPLAWHLANRKKTWKEKVKNIESQQAYIMKVRKSSVEMNRRAFRFLFFILLCISFGLLVPSFAEYMTLFSRLDPEDITRVIVPFKGLLLMAAALASLIAYRDFNDIVHYQKAVERMNRKLEKLKLKIENV